MIKRSSLENSETQRKLEMIHCCKKEKKTEPTNSVKENDDEGKREREKNIRKQENDSSTLPLLDVFDGFSSPNIIVRVLENKQAPTANDKKILPFWLSPPQNKIGYCCHFYDDVVIVVVFFFFIIPLSVQLMKN